MLDRPARRVLNPVLDRMARPLEARGIRPAQVTAAGLAIGVAACVAAGLAAWWWALGLWLANRLLDGVDGPLARRVGATPRGGFLDIMADFAVYGGFVVGVAVGQPDARLACTALLAAYYLNGSALLALSSLGGDDADAAGLAEQRRSLWFVGGLAEGTETISVHAAFCLFPAAIEPIAWVFTAMVALTALHRVRVGTQLLAG